MNKCLFATVLSYPAPSANYRGKSEESRTVIQKVAVGNGRFEYPIMSPEAMRNALREMLGGYGLKTNRRRIEPTAGEGDEKQQLAVGFKEFPDPAKYIDDFFFGYLLAIKKEELNRLRKRSGKGFPLKRDSVLRMNLAKSLSPFRYSHVFTQSPQIKEGWKVGDKEGGTNSALLHRETVDSAFQYPFAFNLLDVFGEHAPENTKASTKDEKNDKADAEHPPQNTNASRKGNEQGEWNVPGPDMETRKKWFSQMLRAIAELTDVAGNHARSLFHMAPASIVIRLTDRMVPGFNSYGFEVDEKGAVSLTEIIDGLTNDDYPGSEFYLGGVIVKQMGDSDQRVLAEKGVRLFRMADQALAAVSSEVTGIDFLTAG